MLQKYPDLVALMTLDLLAYRKIRLGRGLKVSTSTVGI